MRHSKPEHQWQTRQHMAYRMMPGAVGKRVDRTQADLHTLFDGDTKPECFELRFGDGSRGRAMLGLQTQWVDDRGARDPDLGHAVQCWLVARGQRQVDLHRGTAMGTSTAMLQGEIALETLGDLPNSTPRTLVTLCPSNAEMVNALGCFDRVVACEDSSDHPPEVRDRERLGPDLGPDLDRILQLAPDLVVSSLSVPGMERNVTGLRARGVAQRVLAPRSLADVRAEIAALATTLGVTSRGRALLDDLETQRMALERACPREALPVYLEWWPRPMFTPGADCYSNELIALAGGRNVFAGRPGASLEIEPAELLAAAPAICFLSWCGVPEDRLDPDHLIRRPGLQQLSAARHGRVFPLDEAFTGRPGPRMLEAARRMQTRILQLLADETP